MVSQALKSFDTYEASHRPELGLAEAGRAPPAQSESLANVHISHTERPATGQPEGLIGKGRTQATMQMLVPLWAGP